MVRKPNSMYRQVKGPAYTRREYMGGVPASRITQFDLGNKGGEFQIVLSLMVKETCHIRHTALEAARITANRTISRKAGAAGYHLKVRVFPHHVLRENKQATGAGADRVSQGMRKAFGKLVGTAARVPRGQRVITIRTTDQHFLAAKDALRKAGHKLPSPISIVIDAGAELVA